VEQHGHRAAKPAAAAAGKATAPTLLALQILVGQALVAVLRVAAGRRISSGHLLRLLLGGFCGVCGDLTVVDNIVCNVGHDNIANLEPGENLDRTAIVTANGHGNEMDLSVDHRRDHGAVVADRDGVAGDQ
jgi:hypothetical protein